MSVKRPGVRPSGWRGSALDCQLARHNRPPQDCMLAQSSRGHKNGRRQANPWATDVAAT
jgi:hypothetical protein